MVEWKVVPEYPNYLVSSDGQVYSQSSRRNLSTHVTADGYVKVTLCCEGTRKDTQVHQVMAWAFIGPQMPMVEVRHLNGIRTDNRIDNLAYGSRWDNAQDRGRHGNHHRPLGESNGQAKLNQKQADEIKVKLASGLSQRNVAKQYNVSKSAVQAIADGRSWIG